MSTNFDTLELVEARRETFLNGKNQAEELVRDMTKLGRLFIAEIAVEQYDESLQPNSEVPYAFAQGFWHGINYDMPLSAVRAMISEEVEKPKLVQYEFYVTDRNRSAA